MASTPDGIWNQAIALLESSQSLGRDTLSWLKKARLISIEYGDATLSYSSVILYNLLTKNEKLIAEALEDVTGQPLSLRLVKEREEPVSNAVVLSNPLHQYAFNEGYTFDSFVEGASNQEAYMATWNLASGVPVPFNPLLLYGDSGLGKTHLLHAIGNQIRATQPDARLIYMYAGDFVTLLIEAMKNRNPQGYSVEQIKRLLLDCDYFLIDDIQNLTQPATQEIFFTIYNKLIEKGTKIVLTSDLHPKELSGMSARLISRFHSGLSINISKPGFETAKAILKKKLEGYQDVMDFDEEVFDLLALRFSGDVRNLEGCLNRLLFNATLFHPERITADFASQVLANDLSYTPQQKDLDLHTIKQAVARYYGLTSRELEGKSRLKKIVMARQIFVYLCKKMLDATFTNIGIELGKRDHSTIANAYNKANERIASDPLFLQAVEAIESKLDD